MSVYGVANHPRIYCNWGGILMELNLVTPGSNIRKYRQQHNLTIEGLAEIVLLSPSYLGLIERDQRRIGIDKLWHS